MVSALRLKSNPFVWGRKRSDIDIMTDILVEADKGIKKTHIMYRCNLSHSQLNAYLRTLCDMGFLTPYQDKENSELKCFRATTKGLKFLDAYRALLRLMA
jgi:predicted transcriptional regulator